MKNNRLSAHALNDHTRGWGYGCTRPGTWWFGSWGKTSTPHIKYPRIYLLCDKNHKEARMRKKWVILWLVGAK